MSFDKTASALKDFGDLGVTLFGESTDTSGSGTGSTSKTGTSKRREKLNIDSAGIESLVRDVLASEQGLSEVFNEENVAGVFNSSVASQASGDLVAQIAREIAKLTAVKEEEIVEDVETETESVSTGGSESPGLIKQIGGFLGL